MKKHEQKNKVGRPRLADEKLKRTSIIMCVLCLIGVIALLLFGAYNLNILKLKGDVSSEFKTGDKFCLGTECFYTIKDHGDTVTAIAQYNLLVGDVYNATDDTTANILEDTEGYGLQSEIAKGYVDGAEQYVGVVAFADNLDELPATIPYWIDRENESIKEEYKEGKNNTVYVYDENSNLYKYVDGYQKKLNETYKSVKARVMSYDDYETLLCYNSDDEDCSNNYQPELAWVYSSSYWFGFVLKDYAHSVFPFAAIYNYRVVAPSFVQLSAGVRPVIEINKSDIPENRGFKYKIYTKGEEICFNKECFNVISQDDNTVTAIAKYNLLVGYNATFDENNEVTAATPISSSQEGYGIQNEEAKGYGWDDNVKDAIGVLPFKSGNSESKWYWLDYDENNNTHFKEKYYRTAFTDYGAIEYYYIFDDNSDLYQPMINYKNHLINISKINDIKIRVPDYEDLLNVFCASSACNILVPKWHGEGTYYVGFSDGMIYVANGANEFLTETAPYVPYAGIRPVIILNKKDLIQEEKPKEETVDIKTGPKRVVENVKYVTIEEEDDKVTTTTANVKNLSGNINTVKVNKINNRILFLILLIIAEILLILIILVKIKKRKLKNKLRRRKN